MGPSMSDRAQALEAGHGCITHDVLWHDGWRVIHEKTVAPATVSDGVDRSVIRAGGIDQARIVEITLCLDLSPATVFNAPAHGGGGNSSSQDFLDDLKAGAADCEFIVCSGHGEAGKERQDRI